MRSIRFLAALAALAILPAVANAQVTAYAACYVAKSGSLYRIKAPNTPANCTNQNHTPFYWSAVFEALPGYGTNAGLFTVAAGATKTQLLSCPEGKVAISGGWRKAEGLGPEVDVSGSYPAFGFPGWYLVVTNNGATTASITGYVSCVVQVPAIQF